MLNLFLLNQRKQFEVRMDIKAKMFKYDLSTAQEIQKKRQFKVIIEEGKDGNLIGTELELKGCHTKGKTIEELLKNIEKL